uniref:EGF-like domain-containing protein n=1 Tax=Plectus sambesii TaxID=2011161 RepID=A0A914UP19_9BILA
MNEGVCSLIGGNQFRPPTGYQCDCAPGYKGSQCGDVMTSCNDDPCRSGSTCNPTDTRFACSCPPDIDDCPQPDPCGNGKCNDLTNAFSCNCTAGYTGARCETEINECDSRPCSTKDEKAICLNLINDFACICGPDFTGQRCRTGMDAVLQAEDLIKPDGPLSSIAAAAADNNTLAIDSAMSEGLAYAVASLSVEERTALSWTLEEMLDWCTYEEKECDTK